MTIFTSFLFQINAVLFEHSVQQRILKNARFHKILSSIDNNTFFHQISILERFMKDHVSEKTGKTAFTIYFLKRPLTYIMISTILKH